MNANFASWRLTSQVCPTRGSRQALLSDNGDNITVDPETFLKIPYNAGSFNKEELVIWNLDVAVTDELRVWLEKVDAFVIEALAKDSMTYFKKNVMQRGCRENVQTKLYSPRKKRNVFCINTAM